LHQPDFYCPIVRGETQEMEIRMAPARELPKGESACTTIVIARDVATPGSRGQGNKLKLPYC
jgi:hypothetical protein